MTRQRLHGCERCVALDGEGKRCLRQAKRATYYFGDRSVYGDDRPWPYWVRVALCDQHSDGRQDEGKGSKQR